MNRLQTSLGTLTMQNPVTVASGTYGAEFGAFYDLNCLGAYVTKTITRYPKQGNPPPRLYETEAGLLNSIGLQNPGLDIFLSNTLPELSAVCSAPIIVSFSGSTIDEFAEMLDIMEQEPRISGYEVNISCPNVEKEGIAFGVDPDTVHSLTSRLAALTSKELIIKLSPNVTDVVSIARAAATGGATSIALINTLLGMAIDWKTGKSRIKRGVSGYSGLAIKPVALAATYKVASALRIPVLAMGGIYDWKDALEFFYAGASAVAIGTANFANPHAVPELIAGLDSYLQERDVSLSDIIGTVQF